MSLMQGELNSVDVEGRGLVMQNDLRTEHMKVQTDGIAINPFKAAFGEIELTRPTNATVKVLLTESDINRAFNSEFMAQKLQTLTIELGDRLVHTQPQQIVFALPGDRTIHLAADVTIVETRENHYIEFQATPEIGVNGSQVVLKDIRTQSNATSQSLTDALLKVSSQLLNLRNFALNGMELRLHAIDIQCRQMLLTAQTKLNQFPGS
jgi:hypothetical protein